MNFRRCTRFLLVDDEPGDLQLMLHALSECRPGLEVVSMADGGSALDYLSRCRDGAPGCTYPDLLLLDLKMPGLSGLDTLRAIKGRDGTASLPVVVVSTSTLQEDVAEAYRRGAAGYVVKSSDLDGFRRAIAVLCDYWCSLVSLPGRSG